MRLGFFTMPMHPPHRTWGETLKEDREAFILADRLGFHDAFIGEHLTDRLENVTNSFQFLATLIPETKQIKLGTGTCNLSQQHPVLVAAHAAMFDHLSDGRLILGISAGALASDAEVLGLLDEDRTKIFHDAIEAIIALWTTEPPYDFARPGNRFRISSAKRGRRDLELGAIAKPLQKPYPEIVGTVVTPNSTTAEFLGARSFHPMSANFLLPKWVATHWTSYSRGATSKGLAANPADWRVARTIFVADDENTGERYGAADAQSPYRFYYKHLMKKFRVSNRLAMFKDAPGQADDTIHDDDVIDRLMIRGTVSKVVDEILAFREEIGDFGELVYGGVDWADKALARRSMELMATEVMPRVNAALGGGAARRA